VAVNGIPVGQTDPKGCLPIQLPGKPGEARVAATLAHLLQSRISSEAKRLTLSFNFVREMP
jgi:hypothetical protein